MQLAGAGRLSSTRAIAGGGAHHQHYFWNYPWMIALVVGMYAGSGQAGHMLEYIIVRMWS